MITNIATFISKVGMFIIKYWYIFIIIVAIILGYMFIRNILK